MKLRNLRAGVAASLLLLATGVSAADVQVKVTFTNNAPGGGTLLTPLWVGFHDGSNFDHFNLGDPASAALEAIAEEGNPGPLGAAFAGMAAGGVSGVVGGAPFAPGASASMEFTLSDSGSNTFLSFASMLLPTTDFFIGNDSPLAISLAGLLDGSFSSASYDVVGAFDAGTEVNDFNTGPPNPGGVDENGVVHRAFGSDFQSFLNPGAMDLAALNFDNYASIATITIETVTLVPLPASLPLIAAALGGLGLVRRRAAV